MADVAKWEARGGAGSGSSSSKNNYQPDNKKGCWSGFLKLLKWAFIIFVILFIFALIFD